MSDEVFEKVQKLLDSRSTAGERRSKHHHYLKGTLYCNVCHERGIVRRMVVARARGRHGNFYYYFFCVGRSVNKCSSSYISTAVLEEAMIAHYRRIQFSAEFIEVARTRIREALREKEAANLLLQHQLAATLQDCDSKEENLLGLAPDGILPKDKIRTRLTEIDRQRRRIKEQLVSVSSNLEAGASYLETYLRLLADPEALYRTATDQERRQLNQAIFVKVLVESEDSGHALLTEPVVTLAAVDTGYKALTSRKSTLEAHAQASVFHGTHRNEKEESYQTWQLSFKTCY